MNLPALVVSTSFDSRILGLVRDGLPVVESRAETGNSHLGSVVGAIDALLAEYSVSPREIRHVVVDTGPGSFTGIRIGVSAVRAFCQAAGVPATPIGSLDALARAAGMWDGLVVVAKDAKKARVYSGLFRWTAGIPQRVGEELDIAFSDLLRTAAVSGETAPVLFVGSAALAAREEIERDFPAGSVIRSPGVPSAADYAALAADRRFPPVEWPVLVPRYVRKSDAELLRSHG